MSFQTVISGFYLVIYGLDSRLRPPGVVPYGTESE